MECTIEGTTIEGTTMEGFIEWEKEEIGTIDPFLGEISKPRRVEVETTR
jgi:hypothetical protein